MTNPESDDHQQAYIGLPPNHPALAGIGRIANAWAMFELAIDNLIWDLAELDGLTGACITTQFNGPNPRFRALIALCKDRHISEDLVKRLNTLFGQTYRIYEKRNRAVHDTWWLSAENEEAHRLEFSAQRGLPFAYCAIPQEVIDKTVRKITEHALRFQEIADEIRDDAELSPHLKLRPPQD